MTIHTFTSTLVLSLNTNLALKHDAYLPICILHTFIFSTKDILYTPTYDSTLFFDKYIPCKFTLKTQFFSF